MSLVNDRPGPRARGRTAVAARPSPLARPGFSLLELTLVLAIIATLMGVAAFALVGQSTKAKIRASMASMRILDTAIKQYQVDHSVYPDTLARLATTNPPYVEPRSMEDGWKKPFYYRAQGLGGRAFSLMSGGPDADIGTPADNIDVWTMDAQTGGQ